MAIVTCGTCNVDIDASTIIVIDDVVIGFDGDDFITDSITICPCCGDRDSGFRRAEG